MAEMLVRTIDKVNPNDVYLDAKCFKRGDVVAICPDGWAWSALELSSPWWRVVKVPGATESDLSAFLAPEPGDPTTNKMLRSRAFSFDLDAFGTDKGVTVPSTGVAEERRKAARAGTRNADLPATDIATATTTYKKAKTPLSDPNVIA